MWSPALSQGVSKPLLASPLPPCPQLWHPFVPPSSPGDNKKPILRGAEGDARAWQGWARRDVLLSQDSRAALSVCHWQGCQPAIYFPH